MIEKLTRPTAAGAALREYYDKLYALQNYATVKTRDYKIKRLRAEYEWLSKLLTNRKLGPLTSDYGAMRYFYSNTAHAYWLERIRKPVDPTLEAVSDEVIEYDVNKYETATDGGNKYLSALPDYNASEINDTLRERANHVIADDGEIYHEDDAGTCNRTGAICSNDNLYMVVISINRRGAPDATEMWCENEKDNGAFWCEASEEWYWEANFTERDYFHGGSICSEFAGANGRYMWSERCECYVHERDWDSSEHDYEDPDEDEDGERRSQYMHGYHSGNKSHFATRIGIAKRSTRLFFGYEVELVFGDFDEREQFMRECREDGLKDVVFERDGSLDADDEGVEAIFPPYALSELRDPEGEFARVMQLANNNNSSTPQECGVHITINTDTMVVKQRDQFIRALYALHRVSVYVSQRDTDKMQGRHAYASFEKFGDTKYAAVNQRDNGSYEVRMFAGSDDLATLVSYAEYIDAVREWVRTPDAPIFASHVSRADAMTTAAFRRFVTANRNTYPNLAARFGRQLKEAA
jgi:hypothetical protein